MLVSALGEAPRAVLEENGIQPVEMSGFIDLGLQAVYSGASLEILKGRSQGLAKSCPGSGRGCDS